VWVRHFPGSVAPLSSYWSHDRGLSIAVDSSGNVYTTGHFSYTVDFDPGAGTAELTATETDIYADDSDVYVSKLDSSGNYVWASGFGGTSDDRGNSIAVDSSGKVYATGFFSGTADFDPGAGTVNLSSAGSNDVFLWKLDSSGNLAPAVDPGFTLSATSVSVTEAGGTDTFTVVLDAEPGGDVVILASSSDSGEAQVGGPLTFTSLNWDTPQTFTITGVDDSIADGDQQAVFTVRVDDDESHDAYDGVANQSVTATVADDETAGFQLAATQVQSVTEAGSTTKFMAALTTEPAGDVVLRASSGDPGEATVGAPLTFTSSNWDTYQWFTVTGVDDDLDDGDQVTAFTVEVKDDESHDAYDGVEDINWNVTTTDDDTVGFTLSTRRCRSPRPARRPSSRWCSTPNRKATW